MCDSQKWFPELVLDDANLFSFSCEKLKRFTPYKAVPSLFGGVTTSYNIMIFLKKNTSSI